MAYQKLQKRQADLDHTNEDAPYHRQSRRLFTKFELVLLIPLAAFAAGLGVFTVVYMLQHRGTVKPVAIAALGVTSLLIIGVAFVIFRRLRRPSWLRDVELGLEKGWQPLPTEQSPLPGMRRETTDSKGLYAAVPTTRPQSPGQSTLTSKLRLAVKRSLSPGLLSRSSFDSTSSAAAQEDQELLLLAGSPHSVDSSEDGKGGGLWSSIFELSGDARLESLRQANLKRLSRESRRSRYEMDGWGSLASSEEGTSGVQIVVTKPEPTASTPQNFRLSSTPSLAKVRMRETSLAFDPLRANPVHIRRDPSIRQTRSSHDLTVLSRDKATISALRRPRSVEPGLDKSRLGYEVAEASVTHPAPPAIKVKPASPRVPAVVSARSAPNQTSKGLRRAPGPSTGVGSEVQDLRSVYKNGN